MWMFYLLNFLPFLTHLVSANNFNSKLKKCCPKNEVFNLGTKQCELASQYSTFFKMDVVDLEDESQTKNTFPVNISVNELATGLPVCPTEHLLQVGFRDGYIISKDGRLVSVMGPYESISDLDFCLNFETSQSKSKVVAVICDPCERIGVTCVKVCCPHSAGLFDVGNFSCIPPENQIELKPPTWNVKFEAKLEMRRDRDFYIVYDREFIDCPANKFNPSGFLDTVDDYSSYRLFENGSLELDINGSKLFQPADTFCVQFQDVTEDGKHLTTEIFNICIQDDDEVCIACLVYPICATISNIFLVMTFIVYAMLPELHKPLFGKLIMIFLAALFLAYLFMSINAFGAVGPVQQKVGCIVVAFLVQFFFLLAYFWMNIIAFDMFKKFWKSQAILPNQSTSHKKDKEMLMKYSIYGFGLPLLITGITAAVDLNPAIHEDSKYKPEMGMRKCFFDQDKNLASFLFLYLPLLLIQVSNIIFFSLTVRKLYDTWKMTKDLGVKSMAQHPTVIIKIFLIMGINWLFELLSFVAHWQLDETTATILSYFTDIVNMLQGFLIFLVLVFKRSILEKLKAKFVQQNQSTSDPSAMTMSTF